MAGFPRWFLALALCCLTGSLGIARPNILFILCDDLGYGDIGKLHQNARGQADQPHFATPALDSLVDSGLLLNRHYAPAPVCAPSRASLLTGRHQGHAAVRDNQFDKALAANHTIGTVLQRAGYATAVIGKWGLQGEGSSPAEWEAYPTKRGFDHFFGYVRHRDGHNHYPYHEARERPPVELYSGNAEISGKLAGCYTTDLFTAEAKRWITERTASRPDQPFFLYLAYDTPHAGLQVAAAPYPEGGGLNGGVQWLGEPGRAINTADPSIDDYIHPDYASEEWPEAYKRHASMVRRIDSAVADLLQLLRDLGIERETLVVVTSDNGPHAESYGYGEYTPAFFESFGPLDGIKRDTWEGGIRVPTIAHWPGRVAPGTAVETPTQFHDWLATFAELAKIPPPAATDGVSLVPLLTREGRRAGGTVYIEYKQHGHTPVYDSFLESRQKRKRGQMQVLYEAGMKGVRYSVESADDDFEIYDTRSDPGETRNLARDPAHAPLQARMKAKVLRIRRPNDSAPRPYDYALVPPVTIPGGAAAGVFYRTWQVPAPWVPDVAALASEPVDHGVLAAPDRWPEEAQARKGNIVACEGYLRVPQPGAYTFYFRPRAPTIVRLHEALLLDADYGWEADAASSATAYLDAGDHPIRMIWKRADGDRSAAPGIEWSGPGFERRPVSPESWYRTARRD